MTTLGELIRETRLQLGWTQDELGDRCGTTGAYISLIETTGRKWPQTLVPTLSQVLGLSQIEMAIAAGLIEPSAAQPAPPKPERSLLERRIADGVSRLDEPAQRHVLALVELLTARPPQ